MMIPFFSFSFGKLADDREKERKELQQEDQWDQDNGTKHKILIEEKIEHMYN